jgi:hypothetical protein
MSSARFLYPRHFLLLAGFSVVLVALTRLRLLTDLSVCFAVYGALHASALVLALRSVQVLWRRCLFVVLAAGFSVLTVHLGLFAGRLTGGLPGNTSLYAVLGFSAAIGALAYGLLIRLFGYYALTIGRLALIAAGCMLAALLALYSLQHAHFLGRWWLAVLWWYAFSGGLWFCESVFAAPRS